jgi:hypothetical protein
MPVLDDLEEENMYGAMPTDETPPRPTQTQAQEQELGPFVVNHPPEQQTLAGRRKHWGLFIGVAKRVL